MNISFKQLKIFVKLYELKSFTAAADALHMTQSAVSKQCFELESEIGFPLFERSTRRVEPLNSAVEFYAFATEMLATLNAASRGLDDLRSLKTGYLNIAATPLIFYGLICDVVSEFSSRYPEIKTEIFEISTNLAIEYVMNGKVDIAIVMLDQPESRLISEELFIDQIFLACSPNHEFSQRQQIMLSDLNQQKFIMFRDDNNLGKITKEILDKKQINVTSVINIGAMISALGLVKNNTGVSFVPEYARNLCEQINIPLIAISDPEMPKRTLYLIRRKNIRLSQSANTFVSMLKTHLINRKT